MNNTLGERIKELRVKRNWTQDQLGDLIGMKRTNVANYEAGRNLPPADILSKLADIFNVSVDYLLGRTEDPHQIFVADNDDLSIDDRNKLRLFLLRAEELLREKGNLKDEKLTYALQFMEFTFREDLNDKKERD